MSAEFVTRDLIVKPRVCTCEVMARIAADLGFVDSHQHAEIVGWGKLVVPDGVNLEDARKRTLGHPEVLTAFYDTPTNARASFFAPAIENEYVRELPWLARSGLFHAWKYTKGAGIKIYIPDQGTLPTHPDLVGAPTFAGGWDWPSPGLESTWTTHGINVHGLISAQHGPGRKAVGVAPESPVALKDVGTRPGTYGLATAINNGLTAGCHIISLSWGFDVPHNADFSPDAPWIIAASQQSWYAQLLPDLQLRVDTANAVWNAGALLFVSMNNTPKNGDDTATYTGTESYKYLSAQDIPHALSVGGYRGDEDVVRYSEFFEWGSTVKLVTCNSTFTTSAKNSGEPGWTAAMANSFACPVAAGCAALIWSINPAMTNQQVYDILIEHGDDPRIEATAATFRSYYATAKIVHPGKGVMAALTTLPANAGRVFPYVDFYSSVHATYPPNVNGLWDFTADGEPVFRPEWPPNDPEVGQDGFINAAHPGAPTTLRVNLVDRAELRGYSRDANGAWDPTVRIALWVGSTLIYDGPPGRVPVDPKRWVITDKVTVRAWTQSGAVGTETYDDLSSLAPQIALRTPEHLSNGKWRLRGKIAR